MLGLEGSIAGRGDTALPELLTKLGFEGKVELLLASPDRDAGLEKHKVAGGTPAVHRHGG